MSVIPIPAIDPISGLIRTLTPAGGALIREWAEAVAATTGNIEYGVSYNVNLNPVTGVWAGRDATDICWLEKWGDADGKKEIWVAASANAGVVPDWKIVMTINAANGAVGIGTTVPASLLHTQASEVLNTLTLESSRTTGNLNALTFKGSRGTITAPTKLTTDTQVGAITIAGYYNDGAGGSGYAAGSAAMALRAAADWTSSTAIPFYWSFNSRPSGVTTSLMRLMIASTGEVGFGGLAQPTAFVHIAAGTATANTAPLKLTAGTNLTTTEVGAIEYDGTYFYLTNGSATRHMLVTQGRLSKSIAGGAGYTTLTADEASHTIIEVTGAITGNRTVTLPLIERQWTVFNNTTGVFTVTFIGATGTGIVVATGKRAIIYSDTTNIVRATADI